MALVLKRSERGELILHHSRQLGLAIGKPRIVRRLVQLLLVCHEGQVPVSFNALQVKSSTQLPLKACSWFSLGMMFWSWICLASFEVFAGNQD